MNDQITKKSGNYDYTQLPAETAQLAAGEAATIKEKLANMAEQMVDIGQRLIQVKQAMPHGTWGTWLEQEFQWSQRTANRFMAVAERFAKFDTLSNFAQGALYLLSGDDVPDEAREEAVERAAGEHVSKRVAQEIAAKHAPPAADEEEQYQPHPEERLTPGGYVWDPPRDTDDYFASHDWIVTEHDGYFSASKINDWNVYANVAGRQLQRVRVCASILDSEMESCGYIPDETRIYEDADAYDREVWMILEDFKTAKHGILRDAVRELNSLMRDEDEIEDIESVFPHKDSEEEHQKHPEERLTPGGYVWEPRAEPAEPAEPAEKDQGLTKHEHNLLDRYEITREKDNHYEAQRLNGRLRIEGRSLSELAQRVAVFTYVTEEHLDSWKLPAGWWVHMPLSKNGLMCATDGERKTDYSESILRVCRYANTLTEQPNIQVGDTAEPEAAFKPGNIVVWASKDGEKVGRVEFGFSNRIPITIPHTTTDQTNVPYVEPAKLRLATPEEIEEAEALVKLEQTLNQHYPGGAQIREKRKIMGDEQVSTLVYLHDEESKAVVSKNYRENLQVIGMLINEERKRAEAFASKMGDICFTDCLFVGWDEHMSFVRAAYRMHHELWSYHQLATIDQLHTGWSTLKEDQAERIAALETAGMQAEKHINQLEAQQKKLKGEIQEHKDRIAEMSRIASVRDEGMSQPEKQRVKDTKEIQGLKKELDGWRKESIAQKKRIQELENMLAATEEELKEFEAAIKRLEKQEMAA